MRSGIIAFASFVGFTAATLASDSAIAQAYPAKPIRLIVPATPGGGLDASARVMTQALTDDLGWRFVVDNRGGASGRIGNENVPYKGAGPAMIAVLSGEVSLYFGSGATVTPHAKTGKLRLIATSGRKRSKIFPDLPTISETVPGHEAMLWFGILAPAATPKDIVSRLNTAIVTAGGTPKVIEQLAGLAMESVNNSPEEFTAFIKAEITKWGKVVKASGTPVAID